MLMHAENYSGGEDYNNTGDTGGTIIEIQKFNVPKRNVLSKPDQRLLATLEKAVENFGSIYAVQFDDRFDGANVYPHDVTEEEVLEAAARDPGILDPYHAVTRNKANQLIPVPYHLQYSEELKPVIDLVRNASRIAPLSQAPYLTSTARALALGMYEEQMEEWLAIKQEPIVDTMISFNDRYGDRLMGRKFFAWGSVGILNQNATEIAQKVVEEILDIWDKQKFRPEGMKMPNVRVRLEETTLLSGLAAHYGFTADNLPCQRERRERYGSKILVFLPPFKNRIIFGYEPLLPQVVDTDRLPDITHKKFTDGSLDFFLGHEVNHSLIRRVGDEERLGSVYPTFSEMYCTTSGLYQLHQGCTVEEQNHLLAIFLNKTVRDILMTRGNGSRDHVVAHRAIVNSLLDQGKLKISNGLFQWFTYNPVRVFQELEGLINQLEKIGSSGSGNDFKSLIEPLINLRSIDRVRALRY